MRSPLQLMVLAFVLVALVAPGFARSSTPLTWCGTDLAAIDREPDLTPGFAVHVIYAFPPGGADRFSDWAPRLAGDVASIDAWWRTQDAARAPRFDLHDFPCGSVFGRLDLSRVQLTAPVGDIRGAFGTIRQALSRGGSFRQPEKVYLVLYDGATGQTGPEQVCGQAAGPRSNLPGLAVVYLDSCGSQDADDVRSVVAAHELVHALGAVPSGAPNACQGGHVCDGDNDLMTAFLSKSALESHVLDVGRDDYYGHAGTWADLQDSRFLERLDSPDQTAPSAPTAPTVTSDRFGAVRFSWAPALDDVGPLAYRVSQDGSFFDEIAGTTARFSVLLGSTSVYVVRAVDAVGRLSPPVSIRFTAGLGIVDAEGRLVRDTVPPTPVTRIAVRKLAGRVVLSWSPASDRAGTVRYRVRIGTRTLSTTRAMVSLPRGRITAPISVVPVDGAGNIGPGTIVPLSRLR